MIPLFYVGTCSKLVSQSLPETNLEYCTYQVDPARYGLSAFFLIWQDKCRKSLGLEVDLA